MFKQSLVCWISAAGKTDSFKETENENGYSEVLMPWGTEFQLNFRNKLNKRAVIKSLKIDGESVIQDGIVLNPLQDFALKGKMSGLTVSNVFKFIRVTDKIAEYRGRRSEDSLIEVQFSWEKDRPIDDYVAQFREAIHRKEEEDRKKWPPFGPWVNPAPYPNGRRPWITWDSGNLPVSYSAADAKASTIQNSVLRSQNVNHLGFASMSRMTKSAPAEGGITVKGSQTHQGFQTVESPDLETETYTMTFRLVGEIKDKPVKKPVVHRQPQTCEVCGTTQIGARFCSHCGNCLI